MSTWNSSPAFRDRVPGYLLGVPVVLDDTKTTGDPAAVARLAYSIVEGVGRGRGTVGGVAVSASYETVMMASGEQPLVSMCRDGGLRGRVVTLTRPPFGGVGESTAAVVRGLVERVRAHHGHAGPAVVRCLLDHPDRHDGWRDQLRGFAAAYRKKAGGNNLLDRLAEPLAVVAVASKVMHEALAFAWDWADPALAVWDDLAGPAVTDSTTEAVLAAYNVAVANRGRFRLYGRPALGPGGVGAVGRRAAGRRVRFTTRGCHHEARGPAPLDPGGARTGRSCRVGSLPAAEATKPGRVYRPGWVGGL